MSRCGCSPHTSACPAMKPMTSGMVPVFASNTRSTTMPLPDASPVVTLPSFIAPADPALFDRYRYLPCAA